MSYETYEKLEYKRRAGLTSAEHELKYRKNHKTHLDLPGIDEAQICYVPTIDIEEKLVEIETLYAKLKGKQPAQSLILIDAFHSATIEGARTTVEHVKKAFANPSNKSDRMVINTVNALERAYAEGVTERNIRSIWETLTQDVCENEAVKGNKYRDGMVFIGSDTDIIHTPAKPELIDRLMSKLFAWTETSTLNKWIVAGVIHFYFAYVHPFCDGNGRMARIWVQSYLYQSDYKKMKYIPIARSINKELGGYYRSFQESEKIHANGSKWIDITFFLDYFLGAVSDCILEVSIENQYMYTKGKDSVSGILSF